MVCGGGGGGSMSIPVCVRACVCVCVCVYVQCVYGVVMCCVFVHVFVHGASKQSRKRKNEDR